MHAPSGVSGVRGKRLNRWGRPIDGGSVLIERDEKEDYIAVLQGVRGSNGGDKGGQIFKSTNRSSKHEIISSKQIR